MLLCAVAIRLLPSRELEAPDSQWREMFFEDADPLVNIPKITLKSRLDNVTRVTVKNVGSTTLQYSAAGAEHVQLFQEINVDGKWTQSNWDWCGTGKKQFEVAPHGTADLLVDFWDGEKRERMLARFSEKDTKRSGLIVLATEPADR